MRRVNDYAAEVLPPDSYLSADWYELRRDTVSASEVAAILGLSPWVSPFDLWWEKRTGQPSQDETRAMTRGKRREAAIREDFADAHPEFDVWTVGLVRNEARPWQTCTPDALVYEKGAVRDLGHGIHPLMGNFIELDETAEPLATLEAKTDGGGAGWGEDGSDDIPVYYRTQVLWQMDTLGVNVAYVPVWHGFGYKEYVVEYHEADVLLMRAEAERFLQSVRDDRQPDVDAHVATGRRLRKMHPSVIDGEVEVPAAIARQWRAADRLEKAAGARKRLAENRIRQIVGDHRVATVDGVKQFSRSVYDVKERTQTVRAHTVSKLIASKPKEASE